MTTNKLSPVSVDEMDFATPKHQTFIVRGQSHQSEALITLREHVLIGISPFNSKFSPSYVQILLKWAHQVFSSVDVLLPDEAHTALLLHATGVSAVKAMRKVRKELNRHRRLLKCCLSCLGGHAQHTRILSFTDFDNHANYLRLREQVVEAYNDCQEFRDACAHMSLQAILGRSSGVGISKGCVGINSESTRTAIPYIFAEMPFYLDTPDFMEVDSSILIYHRPWPLGEALWAGKFPLTVGKKQGHGIVSLTSNPGGLGIASE